MELEVPNKDDDNNNTSNISITISDPCTFITLSPFKIGPLDKTINCATPTIKLADVYVPGRVCDARWDGRRVLYGDHRRVD